MTEQIPPYPYEGRVDRLRERKGLTNLFPKVTHSGIVRKARGAFDHLQFALDFGPKYPDIRDLALNTESYIHWSVEEAFPRLQAMPSIEQSLYVMDNNIITTRHELILSDMPRSVEGSDGLHVAGINWVEYNRQNKGFLADGTDKELQIMQITVNLEQGEEIYQLGIGFGIGQDGFASYRDGSYFEGTSSYVPHIASHEPFRNNDDQMRYLVKGSLEEVGIAIMVDRLLRIVLGKEKGLSQGKEFYKLHTRILDKLDELGGISSGDLHNGIDYLYKQIPLVDAVADINDNKI
jgi:hypothetical protein